MKHIFIFFFEKLSKEIKNQYVLEIWLDLTLKYLSKKNYPKITFFTIRINNINFFIIFEFWTTF